MITVVVTVVMVMMEVVIVVVMKILQLLSSTSSAQLLWAPCNSPALRASLPGALLSVLSPVGMLSAQRAAELLLTPFNLSTNVTCW